MKTGILHAFFSIFTVAIGYLTYLYIITKRKNVLLEDKLFAFFNGMETQMQMMQKSLNELNKAHEISETKKMIRHEIESRCNYIMKTHSMFLDRRFKTLLSLARDLTIKLALSVYEIKPNSIDNTFDDKINDIKDILKNKVAESIPECKLYHGEVYFIPYLKEKTKIQGYIISLMSDIEKFKNGEFNGESERKFIKFFTTFVENCFNESIFAYKNFNLLPNFD